MLAERKVLLLTLFSILLLSSASTTPEVVENNLEALQEMDTDDSSFLSDSEMSKAVNEYLDEEKYTDEEIDAAEETHENEYQVPYPAKEFSKGEVFTVSEGEEFRIEGFGQKMRVTDIQENSFLLETRNSVGWRSYPEKNIPGAWGEDGTGGFLVTCEKKDGGLKFAWTSSDGIRSSDSSAERLVDYCEWPDEHGSQVSFYRDVSHYYVRIKVDGEISEATANNDGNLEKEVVLKKPDGSTWKRETFDLNVLDVKNDAGTMRLPDRKVEKKYSDLPGSKYIELWINDEKIDTAKNWVEWKKEWIPETSECSYDGRPRTDYVNQKPNRVRDEVFYAWQSCVIGNDILDQETVSNYNDVNEIAGIEDSGNDEENSGNDGNDEQDNPHISLGESRQHSWKDRIEVTENTEISPVYWAEGVVVEQIDSGSVTLREKDSDNQKLIEKSSSETIPQDYVVHVCDTSESSADIIFTMASRDTSQLCGRKDRKDGSETDIEVQTGDPTARKEVEFRITTPEKIAEKGYQVKVTGPETHSKNYEKQSTTYIFTPGKAGEYTVKILPQVLGQNIPLIGQIIQGGALAKTQVEVANKQQERWKRYCESKEYSLEQAGQKIECLRKAIVPDCFASEPADSCTEEGENTVAASVCQDILEYSYNPETQKCTP